MRGTGFDDDFFTPRFGISVVMVIFLAAHFALLRLMESKDRMVIEALRQHQDELDEDGEYSTLIYDDAEDEDELSAVEAQRAAKLSRR